MNFERNAIFDIACGIRPIKAFHPATLLQPDLNSRRLYLDMTAKTIWFYQYCAENGIQGKIDCAHTETKELKDIASSEFVGGAASINKEFWTATVYMNGEAVSTSTASGTYVVNDRGERDSASNTLRKYAISAALMQAGFGIVSAFNMTQADIDNLIASGMQVADKPTVLPGSPLEIQECFYGQNSAPAFTLPTQNAPAIQDAFFSNNATANAPTAPAVQDTFFGNAPAAPAPVNPAPAPVIAPPAPTPPAPAVDPIAAAKQLTWVGSGRFKGKTLGEILSDPSGMKNIAYIANEFTPRSAEAQRVKEAAALILAHEQNK